MLKMVLRNEGKTQIVLGLTAENVERIKAGQPILIDLEELNLHIAIPVDDPVRDGPFETITAGAIAIDYADTIVELTSRWAEALRKADEEKQG